MEISLTPDQLRIIVQISRTLCHTPDHVLPDAIGWHKNPCKSSDVIFDIEEEEIIVNKSPGMHLSYFTSTYHEIAGIALLNDLAFRDDDSENLEPRTTDI